MHDLRRVKQGLGRHATAQNANALILDGPFTNPGNTSYLSLTGQALVGNSPLSVSGANGRIVYGMPAPVPPGIAQRNNQTALKRDPAERQTP